MLENELRFDKTIFNRLISFELDLSHLKTLFGDRIFTTHLFSHKILAIQYFGKWIKIFSILHHGSMWPRERMRNIQFPSSAKVNRCLLLQIVPHVYIRRIQDVKVLFESLQNQHLNVFKKNNLLQLQRQEVNSFLESQREESFYEHSRIVILQSAHIFDFPIVFGVQRDSQTPGRHRRWCINPCP